MEHLMVELMVGKSVPNLVWHSAKKMVVTMAWQKEYCLVVQSESQMDMYLALCWGEMKVASMVLRMDNSMADPMVAKLGTNWVHHLVPKLVEQ